MSDKIQYSVYADVVDVQVSSPASDMKILVDTNIWFWLLYPPGGQYPYKNTYTYINYIKKAKEKGTELYVSWLNFAELSHIIEKSEYVIYCNENNLDIEKATIKTLRHNNAQFRQHVCSVIQSLWDNVTTYARVVPNISVTRSDSVVSRFQSTKLDGYDMLLLESTQGYISNILTDDGDFCTVDGITVYTANYNVINTARKQHKLLSNK